MRPPEEMKVMQDTYKNLFATHLVNHDQPVFTDVDMEKCQLKKEKKKVVAILKSLF